MKLKTKLYKEVKKQLNSMGFYKVEFDNELFNFKPAGKIITEDLDVGYFETSLNDSDTKFKITFQLLPIEPIILELNALKAAFPALDASKNNLLSLSIN
jgi:hypothetical protein